MTMVFVIASCAGRTPRFESAEAYSISVVDVLGEGSLGRPGALVVDWAGSVYVCDRSGNRVVALDPDGSVRAETGGFGRISGLFDGPSDIALDGALAIVVADRGNRRVVRFDRDLNFAGDVPENTELASRFGRLTGVAAAPGGDLWMADEDERALWRTDAFGTALHFENFYATRGRLIEPRGITSDRDGFVFVADAGAGIVSVFDPLGVHVGDLGSGVVGSPLDVALREDIVAVADAEAGVVLLSHRGRRIEIASGGMPRLGLVSGVAFNDRGRLYVSDAVGGRVVVLSVTAVEQ
jgi:DNA-binding beta-propeller fold protein YncE